jgi:serine/threonine protein kinase
MSDPLPHVTFLAPDPAELAPLFPGYEIELLIATGGMGAVYRAVQKSLDRVVAIKILPQEFSKDAAFCAGFEAEAKAMARLNHPNLIGVYDFGEVNGMLYIIMEYVPGKSLFHSAHGIAIDPGEVIRLVTGICDGLAHAHEHGILHRDIKPSNILLDLNAQPKIGDFGLARPIDFKIQEGEEIFGTPHYTAPEVVDSPHSVDYRADIFSVGVLLHELLTGRLPADDPRPASVICRCDTRFDAIIRRASHPIPAQRYHSASEIAKDLRAIASSAGSRVPQTAVPRGPSRVAPSPARYAAKPKSSGSSGMIFLLVAAAIGAAAFWHLKNQTPPGPSAPEPPKTAVATPTTPIRPKTPDPAPSVDVEPQDNPDAEPTESPATIPSGMDSETMPDHAHSSESAPEDAAPEQPKFDVTGFFARARKIMVERATPLITARDKSLLENLSGFERGAKRLIRRIDWRGMRENAEVALENFIKDCGEEGHRIPARIPNTLVDVLGMDSLHDEFLEKQEAIDAGLAQSLFQLSPTYVLGLRKQIERLQSADDPVAIKLIEAEIRKTVDDEDYFPDLMLGKATGSDSWEDE